MTAVAIHSINGASAIRVTKKQTDPVFAALARYRAAEAEWLKTGANDADLDPVLGNKSWKRYAELIATKPTTVAGCAALIRCIDEVETPEGHGLFVSCSNPVKRNGKNFLSRLAATLESLA